MLQVSYNFLHAVVQHETKWPFPPSQFLPQNLSQTLSQTFAFYF